jgi:ADP-ribose pyrophosphatase YjhB (NUDIX family)
MNLTALPIMTVCYPWKRIIRADGSFLDKICIGTHKDSPGARKLRMVDKDNGPGGKKEPGDITVEHCAQRELFEEFGISAPLEKIVLAGIARVNNNGFEAMLYFFFVDEWSGDIPTETKDFRNIRFCNLNDLPYGNMMDADMKYHLPLMLFSAMMRGEILRTNIVHDENMIVTSCTRFEYSRRG